MYQTVSGIRLYYEVSGRGRPVVLLHGWGGNVNSFRPLIDRLAGDFRVYALDLPGFGRSMLPPATWGTQEYAALVASFLEQQKIYQAGVIAHSFGGRVAIILARKTPQFVSRLVLVDSAGIIPPRGAGYYLRVWTVKFVRLLLANPLLGLRGRRLAENISLRLGSEDYRQAGVMRPILVRVVNEDLREHLPGISQPTLLVWGQRDTATPLACGQLMQRLIPQAELVVLEGAGHFSYLDAFPQFCQIVERFLAG